MVVSLSANVVQWAASRGLSKSTLEQMGIVAAGFVFFPDLGKKTEAIFFKYRDGWKSRSLESKSFVTKPGFRPAFWNLEAVLEAKPSTVMITEGELDALALVEAGVPPYQVLSVPTGAREKPSDDIERGYGWALDALKIGLGSAKRFIWCGDSDGPGLALRGDFLAIIGAARFMYVDWPDGIKDANDMLLKEGAADLRDRVLHGGILWPQEGLYRLNELPEPAPLTIWKSSIPSFDGRIHFAPKTLSVVTGQPGHGKTLCFGQLWWDIAKTYDLTCCIASFETRPKPHMRRQIRTLLSGQLEYEMSDEEKSQADAWINEHYLFLYHPEQQPTLEWFLECAETAVVRHGAKIIQLDPWNRLESSRVKNETETEYVLRCLRALYVFAQDMDCHVQIVAHPAKMDGSRRGTAPTLEDISSSKHWENVVDQGFTVHRPQMFEGTDRKTETTLYHRKARFEELGHPCRIMLNYDLSLRKYVPLTID